MQRGALSGWLMQEVTVRLCQATVLAYLPSCYWEWKEGDEVLDHQPGTH